MQNNVYLNILTNQTTTVKPVAIYCRVSTDNQENEGTSLETQRQACLKYCQEHDYQVTRQFIETWSGLSLERPKLDELRELVRNEEISGIVIYCLDRLSRDPTHGVILTQELENHHVTLSAVTEDIDNSELGKLITYLRGYAAKLEAEKIRERTTRGVRARVLSKGLPVTYKEPFGYSWDKTGEKPKLTPNSDYNTVKLILNLAKDGKSYDFIIAELKRHGIPSPGGLDKWNKHTISVILRNPVYAGQYYAFKSEAIKPLKQNGNHKRVNSSVRRLPQEQWHHVPEIEIINPPMTLDQRALLLDQLKRRQKTASRNAKREYLLRGMIYCQTHRGINGQPRIYHGRAKTEDKYYYVCPVGGCKVSSLPGTWADSIAREMAAALLSCQPESFYKLIDGNTKGKIKDYQREQKRLSQEYERVINFLAKLEARFIEGEVDKEVYQRQKAKYSAQKQAITDEQDKILDDISAFEKSKEIANSWERLREKFILRLTLPDQYDSRTEEEFYQEFKALDNESKLNEEELRYLALMDVFRNRLLKESGVEPLSTNEWRELLTTINFRWIVTEKEHMEHPNNLYNIVSNILFDADLTGIVAEKYLKHSIIEIAIPITEIPKVKGIALHSPENGLHNQQYYPIRFSLSDFDTDAIASKGVSR